MSKETIVAEVPVVVRAIHEVNGEFARVQVDKELFKHLVGFNKQMNPALLDYQTAKDQMDRGIRVFNVGDVTIYTRYDKELDTKTKTHVYMKISDAKPRLLSYNEERDTQRENEVALPFSF